MKMALVTPAPRFHFPEIAQRQALVELRAAGHKVDILEQWGVDNRSYDLMIACMLGEPCQYHSILATFSRPSVDCSTHGN